MESLFVNGGFAHRRAPVPGTDDGIFHAQRMPASPDVVAQPLGLSSALLTLTGASASWVQRTVDLTDYADHEIRVVFEWAYSSDFRNDVQIDLVEFDGNSYSFESDAQGWASSENEATYSTASFSTVATATSFESWNRDSGGTPSADTGRADAQDGSWYLYFEPTTADSNPTPTPIANWLRSPAVTLGATPGDLTFYEARSGCQATSELRVYVDVVTQPGQFDPEAGLTLSGTVAQGARDTEVEALVGSTEDVTFAADVVFPASPSDGTLFEKGGAVYGSWVGLRDSGTYFRARAGDGGESVAGGGTPTTACAVADFTDFPTDGLEHTVVWEFRVDPGRVRVWIDGVLKATGDAPGAGALGNSDWEGGAGGMFVTGGGVNVSGEPTGNWPSTVNGNLRIYAGQLVNA